MVDAAGLIGADKILFGSDFPLLAPARYFAEMRHSGLKPDAIAAICGGNAASLFGMEVK